MPGLGDVPPDVRTTYLGEYTAEHAEAIGALLGEQRIVWWTKRPGFLSGIWEHGVRIFVDRDRLDEARGIADQVAGSA
jgi:hypothetical protein